MISPLPNSLKCSPYLLAFPPHIPHAELLVALLSCLLAFIQTASTWNSPSLLWYSKWANSSILGEAFSDTLFTPLPDWCSTPPARFLQPSSIYHTGTEETDNPTSSLRLPTPFYQRDTITKEVNVAVLGQWRRKPSKNNMGRESCQDLGRLLSFLSVRIGMKCPVSYHTVWFGALHFMWDC